MKHLDHPKIQLSGDFPGRSKSGFRIDCRDVKVTGGVFDAVCERKVIGVLKLHGEMGKDASQHQQMAEGMTITIDYKTKNGKVQHYQSFLEWHSGE